MTTEQNALVSGVKNERQEKLKKPGLYILQEVGNDIAVFPVKAQLVIGKLLDGEPLNPEEQSVYDLAINEWWQKKYGFPYSKKAARHEVIMRKYASPVETKEAHTLQEKLLAAHEDQDNAAILKLKSEYQEKYPDQLEGVEVIFGLEQYLKDSEIINNMRKQKKNFAETSGVFQGLTEYNFLLSDFIYNNGRDKIFLAKFWDVLEAIAEKKQCLKQFHVLQRGIVTQVAAKKVLETVGLKTRIAHPAEDAFHAIDLWTDTAAIQVKGMRKSDEFKNAVFLETDTIAFPGVEATKSEIKEKAQTYHINSHFFQSVQKFHAKLSKYKELISKDVRGYFLVIPHQKIDFITGEPAPELIELIKDRINTELK